MPLLTLKFATQEVHLSTFSSPSIAVHNTPRRLFYDRRVAGTTTAYTTSGMVPRARNPGRNPGTYYSFS
eukprot:219602-Amorphochlora_amoeboformis.AAC.2